uniref:Uncharacterized protein n=1 Tax=Rhizophora mucronata TaxID=61149 RepID=A0A2P2QAX8_RHIMU
MHACCKRCKTNQLCIIYMFILYGGGSKIVNRSPV